MRPVLFTASVVLAVMGTFCVLAGQADDAGQAMPLDGALRLLGWGCMSLSAAGFVWAFHG